METRWGVHYATSRRSTVAGLIPTQDEIDRLDPSGIDAVTGRAIHTGRLYTTPPESDCG